MSHSGRIIQKIAAIVFKCVEREVKNKKGHLNAQNQNKNCIVRFGDEYAVGYQNIGYCIQKNNIKKDKQKTLKSKTMKRVERGKNNNKKSVSDTESECQCE